MQQKFRMFLYIIRPNRICVKICDYVNQNTVYRRGIDLSERMVLDMSVIAKAGLLALAAVLLLPTAAGQAAQPEPLVVVIQRQPEAPKQTIRVLRDGSAEETALDTYLTQVVLSEMPASFAPEALKAQAVAARYVQLDMEDPAALAAELLDLDRLSVSVCGNAPHDWCKSFANR